MQSRPVSRRSTLMGVFPFVLVVASLLLMELPLNRSAVGEEPNWWLLNRLYFFLAAYLLIVAGFGYAWLKSFPRWSYPYVIYTLLFAFYWMNVATPGLTIFGFGFGRSVWGIFAWIPFFGAAVLANWRVGTLKPWGRFWIRLKVDWTYLSFGLYTLVLFFIGLLADETDRAITLPYTATALGVIVLGAWVFQNARRKSLRIASLISASAVAILIQAVSNALYWDGRQEYWMNEPAVGIDTFFGVCKMGIIVVGIMMSPALFYFRPAKVSHEPPAQPQLH